VEAYDLLKSIYQERGYRAKDIPRLILEKNLFGLEIDDRAAQLAAFALTMKARADDRGIFERRVQLNVLSIQESKGLDAKEITEALNAPILEEKLPPSGELFEEIADDKAPLFSRKNLSVPGSVSQADVAHLIALFEHGKTFGSLIQVPEELAEKLSTVTQRVKDVICHGGMLEKPAAVALRPLVEQAGLLARRYDAVVTNPPYMGNGFFNPELKQFVVAAFAVAKADLYGCFMLRNLGLLSRCGYAAMITIPNWMFISTFAEMRRELLNRATINSFVHNGRGVWGPDFGSCSFVLHGSSLEEYRGTYLRLFEKQGSISTVDTLSQRFFTVPRHLASHRDFAAIPNTPIAYWVPPQILGSFRSLPPLAEVTDIRQGMSTGNGELYVRLWYEVDRLCSALPAGEHKAEHADACKWFPYNKGGKYRKWYGNREFVLNFGNEGADMLADVAAGRNRGFRMVSREYFFRLGVTWTDISSSFLGARSLGPGFIFENTGSMVFTDELPRESVLGFLCSKLSAYFMSILNPTVHFTVGEIRKLPFHIEACTEPTFVANVRRLCEIATGDWDASETSWDFQCSPLVRANGHDVRLGDVYSSWSRQVADAIAETVCLESDNNRHLFAAYKLGSSAEFVG
jgi:hypothetical protein